jgi:hypothetical protein
VPRRVAIGGAARFREHRVQFEDLCPATNILIRQRELLKTFTDLSTTVGLPSLIPNRSNLKEHCYLFLHSAIQRYPPLQIPPQIRAADRPRCFANFY